MVGPFRFTHSPRVVQFGSSTVQANRQERWRSSSNGSQETSKPRTPFNCWCSRFPRPTGPKSSGRKRFRPILSLRQRGVKKRECSRFRGFPPPSGPSGPPPSVWPPWETSSRHGHTKLSKPLRTDGDNGYRGDTESARSTGGAPTVPVAWIDWMEKRLVCFHLLAWLWSRKTGRDEQGRKSRKRQHWNTSDFQDISL